MHHVIIGAGPAGVVAAETLHKSDPGADITIVGAENEAPYSRMAIPYFLAGNIDETGTYLRGPIRHDQKDHYAQLGMEYVHGRVQKIDIEAKDVHLTNGWITSYDRLLIATGASPVRPPIEGLDLPGVHSCWTLEDARHIAKLARDGRPVVLMGAGFIGSIILESLVSAGAKLTVVEMEDRMVPRMMDETAGGLLKRWCESKGVRVLTGTKIDRLSQGGEGGGVTAHLDTGEDLPADLVVVATGVRPNIDFLEGSTIETKTGIIVDDHMRTSAQHVFAVGDVAEARDFSTGEFSVLAIQPTAVEHGRVAGQNMAGKDTSYQGALSMNVLDTLGLVSTSFGNWMGVEGGEGARQLDEAAYKYLRLEFDGERLVGAQSLGMIEQIGIVRGLIQTARPLGPWKAILMKQPHRVSEAYVALTH